MNLLALSSGAFSAVEPLTVENSPSLSVGAWNRAGEEVRPMDLEFPGVECHLATEDFEDILPAEWSEPPQLAAELRPPEGQGFDTMFDVVSATIVQEAATPPPPGQGGLHAEPSNLESRRLDLFPLNAPVAATATLLKTSATQGDPTGVKPVTVADAGVEPATVEASVVEPATVDRAVADQVQPGWIAQTPSTRVPAGDFQMLNAKDASLLEIHAIPLRRVPEVVVERSTSPGRIVLNLTPRELGSVRVDIRTRGSDVAVHVSVYEPRAIAAVTQHLASLKDQLADRGLHLARLNIDHREDDRSSAYGSNSRGQSEDGRSSSQPNDDYFDYWED